MTKSLAIFALTAIVLSSVASAITTPVLADWLIDRSGALVQVDGTVLGDDDATEEIEKEIEDEVESRDDDAHDSPDRQVEIKREDEKQRLEKSRETLKNQIESRKKIQERAGQKSKFELRTEDGKFKLKQEVKNAQGTTIRKQEIEIKEGESLHVEQENGDPVKINAIKDDHLEIIRNRIKAKSDLEFSVGEKNEISVTLPNGKVHEISVPDKALEQLVENGVIAQVEGEETSYELTVGQNGEPVYEAEGMIEKKILGLPFLKLKFANKIEVAAGDSEDGSVEAGEIVSTTTQETNPLRRFLERISR